MVDLKADLDPTAPASDQTVTQPSAPPAATTNILGPDGKVVGYPTANLKQAMDAGYKLATPDDLLNQDNEEAYGGTGGAAGAFGLGVGDGATFGTFTGALVKAGYLDANTAQQVQSRHQIAGMIGQGVGLVGSSALLPGGGLVGLASDVGKGVAAASGLAEAGALGKVAASALGTAVEGIPYGAGSAYTDAIMGDPDMAGEHIMAHVGMGALMGGLVGGGLGALGKTVELGAPAAVSLAKNAVTAGYQTAMGSGLRSAFDDVGAGLIPKLAGSISPELGDALASRNVEKTLYDTALANDMVGDPTHIKYDSYAETGATRKPGEAEPTAPKTFSDMKNDMSSAMKMVSMATAANHPVLGLMAVGAKIADAIKNPTETALQLANLESAVYKTAQKIESGAASVFSKTGGAITYSGKRFAPGQVGKLASNPEYMVDSTTDATQPIHEFAPKVAQSMNAQVARGVAFLASKQPAATPATPLAPEQPATQTALHQYETYQNTVLNPISVLGHVRNGTVLPEHVEALQATSPNLYQQMQSAVMDHLSKQKPGTVNYQTRLSVSKFMGVPLESSLNPAQMQRNQAVLQGPSGQPQSGGLKPTQGGMGKIDLGNRAQTMFTSTASRER